jgi:general secretion pathway protein J
MGVTGRGFTLLEILIAMAIFTLIGVASTSVLTSVINSDQLSSERFAKLEVLQRTMLVMERDILQAVPRAVRIVGEENTQVLTGGENLFDSDADGLGLVRAGWHNPQLMLPRSTLQTVAYRLQDNKLQRLYSNYVDNVVGFEPKVKTLLEEVDDFQVNYLLPGEGDTEGSENWQESYTGVTLPLAIRIEIDTADFGVIQREFILAHGQN